jgi:anti-sigma-K factor RskA
MNNPELEEKAALHAVGLLDGAELKELLDAALRDEEVRSLVESYAEVAAVLAYDAPQVTPPPAVRRELLRNLPARREASKIIPFRQWLPYAVAACLMALALYQWHQILGLKTRVHTLRSQELALQDRNNMTELRLATLEAKDAAYSSAKVMVAWDPKMHRGVLSMADMPAPPPGHDYQLWILDPTAPAPISAGLLTTVSGSQGFAMHVVNTTGPGFAISLEPSGGRPSPTGAILFAVAPGQ